MSNLADPLTRMALAVVVTLAMHGPAHAIDVPASPSADQADDLSPDAGISRAEWKLRVEQARLRSKETAALARAGLLDPLPRSARDIALQASADVLNDLDLRAGDIVSTVNGFFVYRGIAGTERKPGDFEALPPGPIDKPR